MHNGHDHHDHFGGHIHSHSHGHGHGHNHGPSKSAQWQTPHLAHDHHTHAAPEDPRKTDLDLVEAAFVEAFSHASDVTSFLRVAGVPFVGQDDSGKHYHLLRVETEDMVDVGSVAPLLGGSGVRYDPLPAKMTSRRRRLAFLYHDGQAVLRLTFAETRDLADKTAAAQFETRSA